MFTNKLDTAIEEAERFLKKAKELRNFVGTNPYINSYPKEQGAVKRASMDLTRALAELRNTKE